MELTKKDKIELQMEIAEQERKETEVQLRLAELKCQLGLVEDELRT